MARTSKKKTTKEEASSKVNKTTDDKDVNKEWLVIAMLAHNLLGEVIEAIQNGDLTIPNKSTFNLEEFKNKVGFIEAIAEKTFNEQKEIPNNPEKKNRKLN